MYTQSPVNLAATMSAELITQPLYQARTIADGDTEVRFFEGTGTGNRLLTNVDLSGQLPFPKFQRIGGLRLYPKARTVSTTQPTDTAEIVDVLNIMNNMWLEVTIAGLKPYIQAPAFMFPAGLGVVFRGGDTAAHVINHGLEIFGSFFRLKHWWQLPPQQAFGATLRAPTALDLNASHVVYLILDGEQGREVL